MAIKRKQQLVSDVYDITTMVAGDFSLREVLDKLAEMAVKVTEVSACSIRLLDESANELRMRSTYGLTEAYRNKGVVSKDDAVIKEAFKGKAVVINDMKNDDRIKYPLAATKEGLVSQLTVAMTFKDKPIGVLRLYSTKQRYFDDNDVAMARLVASQCAIAITNARLYSAAIEGSQIKEQMRLAGVIQRRMLPKKAPEIAGLDIAAIYQPCYRVGGDLYDFIQIDENRFAVVIADVIGKGVPAAIMMAMFSGGLRAYIKSWGCDGVDCVSKIVKNLNETACKECRDCEFITLFFAIVDVQSMSMTYCNCGHEPTIQLRKGKLFDLDEGGLVLGVLEDAVHNVSTLKLQSGDMFLFYTDGLLDAVNFEGDYWGREKLDGVLRKYNGWSAERTVKNVLRYRRRFVGLAPQVDDTSIVCIKVDKSEDKS